MSNNEYEQQQFWVKKPKEWIRKGTLIGTKEWFEQLESTYQTIEYNAFNKLTNGK